MVKKDAKKKRGEKTGHGPFLGRVITGESLSS